MSFSIRVRAPIHAEPLDFGQVAPGLIQVKKLHILNTGPANMQIRLVEELPSGTLGQIAIKAPEISQISAESEIDVPVELQISPVAKQIGPFEAGLIIQSNRGRLLRVPIRFEVIDTNALKNLSVSPSELTLDARPGEVLDFQFVLRATSSPLPRDHFVVEANRFRSQSGNSIHVACSFRFQDESPIKPDIPTLIHGQLLAPPLSGTWKGSIRIRSDFNGICLLPITLQLKKE